MKILVVEDEIISQRLLQRNLERWGHQVVCASDGAEALELLQQDHFSIVITDWIMPKIDGLELVHQIRSAPPREYVYIIMLTHKALKEDVVRGLEAGADDFLAKPFNSDELRMRIRAGERVVELERTLSKRNRELNVVNSRMKRELENAASIQKSLLPESVPQLRNVELAWKFQPCDELAGDILNVFELEPGKLGLYILDVSGHGVAAALLSVTLSRMLSPLLDHSSLLKRSGTPLTGSRIVRPAKVADRLNRRFQIEENNEQYFTLLYGILNTRTRKINYVSAGHPGMIYQPYRQVAEVVKTPSLPIGFSDRHSYQERSLQLREGDRLYWYSDGIVEARNPRKESFGYQRLLKAVAEGTSLNLQDSLSHLLEQVRQWCRSTFLDDISLLALHISRKNLG